jgi:hypothetical protein
MWEPSLNLAFLNSQQVAAYHGPKRGISFVCEHNFYSNKIDPEYGGLAKQCSCVLRLHLLQ